MSLKQLGWVAIGPCPTGDRLCHVSGGCGLEACRPGCLGKALILPVPHFPRLHNGVWHLPFLSSRAVRLWWDLSLHREKVYPTVGPSRACSLPYEISRRRELMVQSFSTTLYPPVSPSGVDLEVLKQTHSLAQVSDSGGNPHTKQPYKFWCP